jgi:hypothetical protein
VAFTVPDVDVIEVTFAARMVGGFIVIAEKRAVTVLFAFIVIVQLFPDEESQPFHPWTVYPGLGVAVNVTVVPPLY